MEIKISAGAYFIFDLDDTLYLEREFLLSAFMSMASEIQELTGQDCLPQMLELYNSGANVFQWIGEEFGARYEALTIDKLLHNYRTHQPFISLCRGAGSFLQQLKDMLVPMGMITDGRSISQRNKLKALGIEALFSDIIISEEFGTAKPSFRNYEYFSKRYPSGEFYFFGDNTGKDFMVPYELGWRCFCIKDNGLHIHPQTFNNHPPVNIISSFDEIRLIKKCFHE
jgi:putative hydrolase of the HAD superfamily